MRRLSLVVTATYSLWGVAAFGQPSNMGTDMVFQGYLQSGGTYVTSFCKMKFGLWDAPDPANPNGNLLGTNTTESCVPVSKGIFVTPIGDFGVGAIDGTGRWIEITIACDPNPTTCAGLTVNAQPLTPRLELRPEPHALALPGLWTQQNDNGGNPPVPLTPNVIGGYWNNVVDSGVAGVSVIGAAISGGGEAGSENVITDHFGWIGGGKDNQAGNNSGQPGDAEYAAVGGGKNNTASGELSTVPGGENNTAGGQWSFAAGREAQVQSGDDGTFVWADSEGTPFVSTGDDQFLIRAAGGVGIGTTNPLGNLHVVGGSGQIRVEQSGAGANSFWNIGTFSAPNNIFSITQSNSSGTSLADRVVIDGSSGNVGIGQSPPTEKLHVGGTARMSGFKMPSASAGTNKVLTCINAVTGEGDWIAAPTSGSDSDDWKLAGNSGISSTTNFLGPINAADLRFRTTNSERMTITAGGQVGIATTTPEAGKALDVVGTVQMTGFEMPTGAAPNFVLTSTNASGVGTWQPVPPAASDTDDWKLSGNSTTDPDINFVGTINDKDLVLRVNNARVMLYDPDPTSPNLIGGFNAGTGTGNRVLSGVVGARIGGGGNSTGPNVVTDNYGVIGGGSNNQAGDAAGTTADRTYATVCGGLLNFANGQSSVVGGGLDNRASQLGSTIAGGSGNRANGNFSSVPGGVGNYAEGHHSFAAGRRAKVNANHHGTFVWADSDNNSGSGLNFTSSGVDQFLIRAGGGVGIGTTSPSQQLHVHDGAIHVTATNDIIPGLGGPMILLGGGTVDDPNGIWGMEYEPYAGGLNFWKPSTSTSGAGNFFLFLANNGNVGIGTATPSFTLDVNGSLAANLPSGFGCNVVWDSFSRQFFCDSSSRRYKENITTLQDDFERLLDARPVVYTRPERPDQLEIGWIAEEIHDLGLTHLTEYDAEKRPEGVNYRKAVVYLTEIAKGQAKKIDCLEAENAEIKTRVERLENLQQAGAPQPVLSSLSLPIVAFLLLGSLIVRNRRSEGGA